ncbi:hypothetical protein MY5147_006145 [Beauveria neobassiana]
MRSFGAPLRWAASARTSIALPAARAVRFNSSSSSTSAIAYKALRRRSAPLPLTETPPSWSAQAAVSNILYETPTPSMAPPKRHILNCLVQNEPGVLSRLSGILAARGFNIDSLVVCNTEVEDLSRMTIVLTGQDGVVEQARRQLEDLVPYFEELLAHHREITTGDVQAAAADPELNHENQQTLEESAARDFHPSKLAASEALRHKHEHLKTITYFTHQFGGKVLDISTVSCIVEVSAKPSRIDSFLKLVAPFGILESARTGLMALPRSPLKGPNEEQLTLDADEIVDASQLPPG